MALEFFEDEEFVEVDLDGSPTDFKLVNKKRLFTVRLNDDIVDELCEELVQEKNPLMMTIPRKEHVLAVKDTKAKEELEQLKSKHLTRAIEALKRGETHLTSVPNNEEVIDFIRSHLAPAGWVTESKTTDYTLHSKRGNAVPRKSVTLYFK